MAYFDGIQVGDEVWSFQDLWGVVISIDQYSRPIRVNFGNDRVLSFSMDGKQCLEDIGQTLYWDEIKITPPPKPKKKKKKTAECWANIYDGNEKYQKSGFLLMGRKFFFHAIKAQAIKLSADDKLIATAKVQIEWEE